MSDSINSVTFKDVYLGSIGVRCGCVHKLKIAGVKGKIVKGSVGLLGLSRTTNVENQIRDKALYPFSAQNCKLHIYPRCKVAREHFRKSGYRLVRDADKADICIIPDPKNILEFNYDIASFDKNNNNLILYTVYYIDNFGQVYNDSGMFPVIKNFLEHRGETVMSTSIDLLKCIFVHPDTGYEDILLNKYPQREYMVEDNVPITSAVNINLETLDIWKSVPDEMIPQIICQSDWYDYPTTVYAFLYSKRFNSSNTFSSDFRYVLDKLNYSSYYTPMENLSQRIISPKDWNMLQDWIKHLMDTEFYTLDYIPSRLADILELTRSKVMCAPLYITEPLTFDNVKSLLK